MPSEEGSSGRIGSRGRDGVPEAALLHEDPTFPATGHAKLERPAPSLLGHAHEEAVFFPAQMQAIAFDPCSADELHVTRRRKRRLPAAPPAPNYTREGSRGLRLATAAPAGTAAGGELRRPAPPGPTRPRPAIRARSPPTRRGPSPPGTDCRRATARHSERRTRLPRPPRGLRARRRADLCRERRRAQGLRARPAR